MPETTNMAVYDAIFQSLKKHLNVGDTMDDNLYAYVMRGELTKVALEKTPIVSKHSSSEMLAQEYVECLALDLLDDEKVNAAKLMATVYTAIAAFENTVRQFIVKVLLEHKRRKLVGRVRI